jgi:glycosyltransferase involved in cell wall biosynthesis
LAAAGERSDVVFIDETLDAGRRDALVAACDCYLSLHRAEGHGLPLAEAMAAGKPVVATGYGGNTEFMNDQNSYLVRSTPALVGPGVEHYPEGARWAEPDIDHAAVVLRALFGDRRQAGRRAALGRETVERLLAPEVVGARMYSRLQQLEALGARRATRTPGKGLRRWWRLGRTDAAL